MKLIRIGEIGEESPGVELEVGKRVKVSPLFGDCDERFFGSDAMDRLRDWVAAELWCCEL